MRNGKKFPCLLLAAVMVLNLLPAAVLPAAAAKAPAAEPAGDSAKTLRIHANEELCDSCDTAEDEIRLPDDSAVYTVSFSVPAGVDAPKPMTVEAGAGLDLPVVEAPNGWSFVGWVTENYDNVTVQPAGILTGDFIPQSDITLYALFCKPAGAGDGDFLPVTETLEDWSGRYVISSADEPFYVLKGLETNAASYEQSDGAAPLEAAEISLNDGVLANVNDLYVFEAEVWEPGRYTLCSASTHTYLWCFDKLRARNEANEDCAWEISFDGDETVVKDGKTEKKTLRFFRSGGYFLLSNSSTAGTTPIRLWKERVLPRIYSTKLDLFKTWSGLQRMIDQAQNGETLVLSADYLAEADDAALNVSAGKTLTLDLNGHSLNRGLAGQAAAENGCVIINSGNLTLQDSSPAQSGTVTGGWNTGSGGGIRNLGALTLKGGRITGNRSEASGGGVWNAGTLSVSGSPVVRNNEGVTGSNLYLPQTAGANTINIVDALTEQAELGVYTQQLPQPGAPVVFTAGLPGQGTADSFFSDREGYAIALSATGEAVVSKLFQVTLKSNEALCELSADKEWAVEGETVIVCAAAARGFRLGEVEAQYESAAGVETELELTRDEADPNVLSFQMPAGDVQVNASFLSKYYIRIQPGEAEGTTIDLLSSNQTGWTETPTPGKFYESDGKEYFCCPENDFVTPAGKRFAGWSCGEAIFRPGDLVELTDSQMILTAVWKTPHTITVSCDPEIGTLTASPDPAVEGETVTLTAVVPDGYSVAELTASWQEGEAAPVQIELTAGESPNSWTFVMVDHEVQIQCSFEWQLTITVDFGAGHEDFVSRWFGGKDGFTVNGSRLSFEAENEDGDYDGSAAYQDCIESFLLIDEEDLTDGGERFMMDVALHPVAWYLEEADGTDGAEALVRAEQETYAQLPLAGGVYFRALWAGPVSGVQISATPPSCGTELTRRERNGVSIFDPAPELSVSGPVSLRDDQFRFTRWTNPNPATVASGGTVTLDGGQTYSACVYPEANWGYYLPPDFVDDVVFTGCDPQPEGFDAESGRLMLNLTAVHVEGEPVQENYVEPMPTVAGGYDMVTYCVGCLTELSREHTVVPATMNGFFLIGPRGWTVNAIDPENDDFAPNPGNADEYMLSTSLSEGDPIKVVRVENGVITAWYPDGMDNEYVVDAAHAGEKTVLFSEQYCADWAEFGGYIWIDANPPTVVTVTIDFGVGREAFVNRWFGNNPDYTVTGHVLSFEAENEDGEYDGSAAYQDCLQCINDADMEAGGPGNLIDSNQRFMMDVALHPVTWYLEEAEGTDGAEALVHAERETYAQLSLAGGVHFRALWANPISDVQISATPPSCGTVLTRGERNGVSIFNPAPELSVTGPVSFYDVQTWFTRWTNPDPAAAASGGTVRLQGGRTYTALAFLKANWGYYLQSDYTNAVSFENCELKSSGTGGNLTLSLTAVHVEGEPVQENYEEPTPTAAGGYDMVTYCVGCQTELRREHTVVPATMNGFFLIGPRGWTVNAIDPENDDFAPNPGNADEYMLSTSLSEGDPIKVVRVENGVITAWYPDGMDNEYVVDAAHAGEKTVLFSEQYCADWAEFGGYFWIKNDYVTVTVDFGEGHEGFVCRCFGDDPAYTVNGFMLSYSVDNHDGDWNGSMIYDDCFQSFQSMVMDEEDLIDGGERFMMDVALYPTAYYLTNGSSYAETMLMEERGQYSELPLEEGVLFRALWANPVSGVQISATPPICGTELNCEEHNSIRFFAPAPEIFVSGPASLLDKQAKFTRWTNPNASDYEQGQKFTLQGGGTYSACVYPEANWGYYLPSDFVDDVVFTGCDPQPEGFDAESGRLTLVLTAVHKWDEGVVTTPPTVETEGVRTYTCSACHATKTELIPKLLQGFFLIGPDGWTVEDVRAEDAFAPNPGNAAEYMLSTTLQTGDPIKVVKVEQGAITVWYPEGTGNEYVVDAAHAGEKTVYFSESYRSDWADFGGYIWIDANQEPVEPIPDPSLRLFYSVSTQIEIRTQYSVLQNDVQSFDSWYVEISKLDADGNPTETKRFGEGQEGAVEAASAYAWSIGYTDITAKDMGVPYRATLHAFEANGQEHYSESVTKTIREVLLEVMQDDNSSRQRRTLAADMLNYGAAAQVYFDFDTGNLVNENLSAAEQEALDHYASTGEAPANLNNTSSMNVFCSTSIRNRIILHVALLGPTEENVKVRLKELDGNAEFLVDAEKQGQEYAASYSGLTARDMRKAYEVSAMVDGEAWGTPAIWSVEGHIKAARENPRTAPAELALMNALLHYVDSVAAAE